MPAPIVSAVITEKGKATKRMGATVLVVSLVACSGTGSDPSTDEILVSAAASLTDAFGEVESVFEEAHPGVDVILNLGGSSTLREQILDGAPADVFASANQANMDQVVGADVTAGAVEVFATNRLAIAVPVGNPGDVTGLESLANPDLLVGLCAEGVPCGDFAREALKRAGVTAIIDTNEPDVRALLTKVELGELDAGITYVSDVISTDGAVDGVAIPPEFNVVAEYPIAVLAAAPNQHGADEFLRFVTSDAGGEILISHGFDVP